MSRPLEFSVIVPTLNEAAELPAAVESVDVEGPSREILIADGGSSDGTADRAPAGARVIRSARGRARQMNAAAREARGETLLFLHADCRLPHGALGTASLALQDPAVVGGAFRKRFDSSRWLLRGGPARSSLWFRLGAALGDQALFVRRSEFDALGGFSEAALAEDLDLFLRLRRRGRVVLLPPVVSTSARRLLQQGILRTWLHWWSVALRQHLRTALVLRERERAI